MPVIMCIFCSVIFCIWSLFVLELYSLHLLGMQTCQSNWTHCQCFAIGHIWR